MQSKLEQYIQILSDYSIWQGKKKIYMPNVGVPNLHNVIFHT